MSNKFTQKKKLPEKNNHILRNKCKINFSITSTCQINSQNSVAKFGELPKLSQIRGHVSVICHKKKERERERVCMSVCCVEEGV